MRDRLPLGGLPLDDDLLARGSLAREEWRADELEWTTAAFQRWRHGRGLVDVAREHMHRGDHVAWLTLPEVAPPLIGPIVAVGRDVVAIDTGAGRADVHLGGATIGWRVLAAAARDGTRGRAVESFRSRLLELELAADPVEVGVVGLAAAVCGPLTVGDDHVTVESERGAVVLSLAAVQWVRASTGAGA